MNDVQLEHRLTKIEAAQFKQGETLDRIEAMIRDQNGKVATHIAKDEAWMDAHDLSHAQAFADKSFAAGVEQGKQIEQAKQDSKTALTWSRRDVLVAGVTLVVAILLWTGDTLLGLFG